MLGGAIAGPSEGEADELIERRMKRKGENGRRKHLTCKPHCNMLCEAQVHVM
jgi:hypothetical protein